MYLSQQTELNTFIEEIKDTKILALDTEFLRERTYDAKLCLIQIATEDRHAIIDPIAIKNLQPLVRLLENPDITKIFHAFQQDVEILRNHLACKINSVFDTQIAASLLSTNYQVSYASLVSLYFGVHLSKTDTFTDWSKRPLTESQMKYAADDVTYLPEIFKKQNEELRSKNRFSWFEGEMKQACEKSMQIKQPIDAYKKLKKVNQLSNKQMLAAREFAAWREIYAKKCDRPRKWILRDEQIIEACKREAKTLDELFMVRGISDRLNTAEAREALKAINRGLKSTSNEVLSVDKKQVIETSVEHAVELMNVLVKKKAREIGVASLTLASQQDLVKLARGQVDGCEVLLDWRRKIIGEDLIQLLKGNLAIKIEDEKIVVFEIDSNERNWQE